MRLWQRRTAALLLLLWTAAAALAHTSERPAPSPARVAPPASAPDLQLSDRMELPSEHLLQSAQPAESPARAVMAMSDGAVSSASKTASSPSSSSSESPKISSSAAPVPSSAAPAPPTTSASSSAASSAPPKSSATPGPTTTSSASSASSTSSSSSGSVSSSAKPASSSKSASSAKPAPSTSMKPVPSPSSSPSAKPVHLALRDGDGVPCILFEVEALEVGAKGHMLPQLTSQNANFTVEPKKSNCPTNLNEDAKAARLYISVSLKTDEWDAVVTIEMVFVGLVQQGQVVSWANEVGHIDVSGTQNGDPVMASQSMQKDVFQAARGYGYHCAGRWSAGGVEIHLVFVGVKLQPFHVDGNDVSPAPQGTLDVCLVPEKDKMKTEAAVVGTAIGVLALVCIVLVVAIVHHYNTRGAYTHLTG
eukprot:m.51646 g.51646  ORF g.51646 m.51646 type:complete len:420 (-) comp6626_c0_seq2:41-1300(-)